MEKSILNKKVLVIVAILIVASVFLSIGSGDNLTGKIWFLDVFKDRQQQEQGMENKINAPGRLTQVTSEDGSCDPDEPDCDSDNCINCFCPPPGRIDGDDGVAVQGAPVPGPVRNTCRCEYVCQEGKVCDGAGNCVEEEEEECDPPCDPQLCQKCIDGECVGCPPNEHCCPPRPGDSGYWCVPDGTPCESCEVAEHCPPCHACNPKGGCYNLCDPLCQTCEDNQCAPKCDPEQCQGCDKYGNCFSNCMTCQTCEDGSCADNCNGNCEICFNNQCESNCADSPCYECEESKCEYKCKEENCESCNENQGCLSKCSSYYCKTCQDGECVSSCDENNCEVCDEGNCVSGCTGDCEHCDGNGNCINDCPGKLFDCEVCRNGECVKKCEGFEACGLECNGLGECVDDCGPCETCTSQGCYPSDCEESECEGCVDDKCKRFCDKDNCMYCDNGICRDRCWRPCHECRDGQCVDLCGEQWGKYCSYMAGDDTWDCVTNSTISMAWQAELI